MTKNSAAWILVSLLLLLPGGSAHARAKKKSTASNESKGVAFAKVLVSEKLSKGMTIGTGVNGGAYLFLSWKVWTLIGDPVYDSTAIWMISRPLYIWDSTGQGTVQTRVPDAVAAKIKLFGLKIDFPLARYYKAYKSSHTVAKRITGYYLRLDPGAMGWPVIGDLRKVGSMNANKRARHWSFNVPGSTRWSRLFSDASNRSFMSASAAKRIVKHGKDSRGFHFLGFSLGSSNVYRPFATPSNWNIPRRIPKFGKSEIKSISWDFFAALEWYTKLKNAKKLVQELDRSLNEHLDNIVTCFGVPVAGIRSKIKQIVQSNKPEVALKELRAIQQRLLKRKPPSSFSRPGSKKCFEKKKKETHKKLQRKERRIMSSSKGLSKAARAQRRASSKWYRRRRKAHRGKKRSAACHYCRRKVKVKVAPRPKKNVNKAMVCVRHVRYKNKVCCWASSSLSKTTTGAQWVCARGVKRKYHLYKVVFRCTSPGGAGFVWWDHTGRVMKTYCGASNEKWVERQIRAFCRRRFSCMYRTNQLQ